MLRLVRAHSHFLITITLLTLAVTFPTIEYVLRTDVFWHPGGGDYDVYVEFWEIMYGAKVLSGQADRFYTDLLFYPEGVSLAFHKIFWLESIFVNVLSVVLPISNAFSAFYLFIIFSSAFSAYVYALWLFKDRWIALCSSVVFGLSPLVTAHPHNPSHAWIALIPLSLYFFHRGLIEDRRLFVAAAGLLAGLAVTTILYVYAIVGMSLAFYVVAFAIRRWRDPLFWRCVLLLFVCFALTSFGYIFQLLSDAETLNAAIAWHGAIEIGTDALSYLVNFDNPIFGSLASAFIGNPDSSSLSSTSVLGFAPLLLIGVGYSDAWARRKMLPWSLLCAPFLVLRLGSHLTFNGVPYPEVLLPKHFLDLILPSIFEAFWEADHFMMGALLPFALLTGYGLVAVKNRFPHRSASHYLVLALSVIITLEYYVPVKGVTILDERTAFLDWLEEENERVQIRLINVPMGRLNAKRYMLDQALSGYPHAEGTISRTPVRAYDYVRANYLLNAWHSRRPIHCEMADRDDYLAGLAELDEDGFSHVVYHQRMQNQADIHESFEIAEPTYSDDYVAIYRLSDLRDSCPAAPSARQRFTRAYADALLQQSILDERPGPVAVFPPTPEAGDHLLRYLRYFTDSDHTVLTIAGNDGRDIRIRSSELPNADTVIDLEQYAALWLVNDRAEFDAESIAAYQEWFNQRFSFCARYHERERENIDLYLRADIPCSAIDGSSAFEVSYDGGAQLHNLSYVKQAEHIRFFLAWSNPTPVHYAFSLQFFDDDGRMALQHDAVINRWVLTSLEMDTSSLPDGTYSIQLIVYDYETRVSQGGTLTRTGGRFERELEIASIKLRR